MPTQKTTTRRPTKKRLSPIEAFLALSDAEKEAEVAEFDKEFVEGKPLTPRMRERWNRIQKELRLSRPRKGDERVIITVKVALLKEADAYAKKTGMSLSQLVGEGLKTRLKAG